MDGVVRVQRLFMEAPPFSSLGTVRNQDILRFEMGQSGSFLPGLGRERLRRFGEHAVDMPWIENERQRMAWKLNQQRTGTVAMPQVLHAAHCSAIEAEVLSQSNHQRTSNNNGFG